MRLNPASLRRLVPLSVLALAPLLARCGDSGTGPASGGPSPSETFGAKDIFVDAGGGNDSNDGTRERPFATVDKAVFAADTGATIRLAAGTYTSSGLALRSRVSVVGSYEAGSWQRSKTNRTRIVWWSGAVRAIDADSLRLEGIDFAPEASSRLTAALELSSSFDVELRDVTITAPRGADPIVLVPPRPASPGTDGNVGREANLCPVQGATGGGGGFDGGHGGPGGALGGFAGTQGKGPAGGSAGAGGAAFKSGGAGRPASRVGADGADATAGGKAMFAYYLGGGYVSSAAAGQSGSPGGGGSGGGGGGGGGGLILAGFCGGGGGGGGGGGAGGDGGFGGFRGRPSIGLAVLPGSKVRLINVRIVTGGGGRGGDGTVGGVGGVGGKGGAGGATHSASVGAGGAGGAGSVGGNGGAGSGGAGGPSVGLLVVGDGMYTAQSVTYDVGPAGAGGAGAGTAPSGEDGIRAEVLHYDPPTP